MHFSDMITAVTIISSRTIRERSHQCQKYLYVQLWASECPDVKNYKWRLNTIWHRMLYWQKSLFSTEILETVVYTLMIKYIANLKFYVNETYDIETETRPRHSRPRLLP